MKREVVLGRELRRSIVVLGSCEPARTSKLIDVGSRSQPRSEEVDLAALQELLASARPTWSEVIRRVAYWPREHDLERAVAMVDAVADQRWSPSERKLTGPILDQLRQRAVSPCLRLLRTLDVDVPALTVGERFELLERMIHEGGLHELHAFATVVAYGDHVIARLAAHITGLRVLSIGQSAVSTRGAHAIAASSAFGALERLSLHSNAIDDEGAQALLESQHLAGLRYLNLYQNRIGPEMVARIRARPEWRETKIVIHQQR